MRKGAHERTTTETAVAVTLDLDGTGPSAIATGVRMFDHLLAQLAFHSGFAIAIDARSLDGIEHHVIEDTAIALGRAFAEALGDRSGIERYGSALLPMDDALVQVAVDLGGRFFARLNLPLRVERIEGMETAMVAHFFRSFAVNAAVTLHLDLLAGEDPHHSVEAAFKAFARALAIACRRLDSARVLSTKGSL
jgi:imidazoleglycerol-phosphate dehydratase